MECNICLEQNKYLNKCFYVITIYVLTVYTLI